MQIAKLTRRIANTIQARPRWLEAAPYAVREADRHARRMRNGGPVVRLGGVVWKSIFQVDHI